MPSPSAGSTGAEDAAIVAWLRPLQAAMGITRLADITGLDRLGIPVFAAIRPNARSVAVSQGKGLTKDAARISALMEAAESWHAEHIQAPLLLAAADELTRPRLEALDRLPVRQGKRLDLGRPCLWIEGRSPPGGSGIWVPYELVHTDYRLPQPPAIGCYPVSSNGLGAGRTMAHATRHALCELIERDAYSLWQHRPARARAMTAVNPASIDDEAIAAILDRLAMAGFAFALFDITSDLAVPAYLAAIADLRDPGGHPGLGTACHPKSGTALRKALLEAVQVRTTYIAGARDDLTPAEFQQAGHGEKQRAFVALLDLAADARRPFAASRRPVDDDAAADVASLLATLAAAGMGEAISVDLSRPEIGVAVVRLIVPGLEGCADDADYAPGERARRLRAVS